MNVVLLMLDDMRFDQVGAMPEVQARSQVEGVTFSRAYRGTPLCSPTRASLLSGGFPAAVSGVLTNDPPDGGVSAFVDADSLAVRLQAAGYATGLVGKYLNGYPALGSYVPPGWTQWAAWLEADNWSRYRLVEGSSGAVATVGRRVDHTEYITDVQGAWAERFIEAHRDEPFFLDVAFVAPHDPHTPAAEDAGSSAGFLYRGGAYQEADVSDKPGWIQAIPLLTVEEEAAADLENQERQETLLAVDRAVTRIVAALETNGVADRTVVFLVSDNGELWGEHRVFDKGVPYQEAVHVPLLVWGAGLLPAESAALVDPGLDIAATVQAVTGLAPFTQGVDLGPLLCGAATGARDHLVVQDWSREGESWSGLLTERYTYVEWATGERELYDRDVDPIEATSLHADPDEAALMDGFAATLDAERGLGGASRALASGVILAPYAQVLQAWGGTAPLTWTQIGGSLPRGVSLAADGTLSGLPREGGSYAFAVRVTDSSVSPVTGGPQSVVAKLNLRIEAAVPPPQPVETKAGCGCAIGGGEGGGAVLFAAALLSRRRRG